ncbi:hypothetical protein AV540_04430 [Brevibacillus parabrevis]|uniref:phosphoribosylamine--glycine ligase n=1 Tax=Brevibacillus parabrevis TaxID=54914 RepID=UPI0007AB401E|nr:hypothetical protein [Brevibacillus parabrevis]KZE55747.1 hypothetical protein AV540_04430 [Brevibacillus parabrevis]
MSKIKCLVVGDGGREASIVSRLKDDCIIFSVMRHKNPTIVKAVEETGGVYIIDNPMNGEVVSQFAKKQEVDIAVVNSDEILAAGVVDFLQIEQIPTFGPTKEGARIEWSKTYGRNLVSEIEPSFNPKHVIVSTEEELTLAFKQFNNEELVIKPDGLTGGKGVKVMGKHLENLDEAYNYAKSLLSESNQSNVVIEEKIEGYEFTIMGITDGENIVFAPPTFDYPYRFEGDNGPGTGGMGCFTHESQLLPFLTLDDLNNCHKLMSEVVKKINNDKLLFNGVLNGGFFKLKDGSLRFMEFNARIGDPECLNVMELISNPLSEVIQACIERKLSNELCQFKDSASIVVYIVSEDYAMGRDSKKIEFKINEESIVRNGAKVIYSACEMANNQNTLSSVGSSRLAAIVMEGKSLASIRQNVYKLLDECVSGFVDWRKDIASEALLERMEGFKQ